MARTELTRVRDALRGRLEPVFEQLPPARRLRMALATEAVERFAAGRRVTLLDAGCETGLLTTRLAAAHPDWEIVAVDLREESVRRTRERTERAGVANVRVEVADLTQDVGSERYDVIVASECLAEIPDDAAAVRRMATALRPGGRLVLHVPIAGWRPVLTRSVTQWKGNVRDGYTTEAMTTMIEAAGLRVLDRRPTTHAVVHLAQELREIVKLRAVWVRALLLPFSALAVWAERHGARWGVARGQLFEAGRA